MGEIQRYIHMYVNMYVKKKTDLKISCVGGRRMVKLFRAGNGEENVIK